MDALNRWFQHGKELFGSLSPAMRVVAVGLTATVVLGLGYLFTHGFAGGDSHLLGGRTFNASEITAAEKAFAKAGLSQAKIDGNRIRVPGGQESAYVAAMADAGVLPTDFHLILDETLGEISPFMPPKQREELVKNAKQRELSNIIRAMPGIEAAAVLFDQRRPAGFARKSIVTASVTVWPELGQSLRRGRGEMIRQLVASAIAGLDPGHVTVTDAGGGSMQDDGWDDWCGEGNEYLEALRAYQRLIESKVLTALAFVPGVRVAANVELRPELEMSEETKDVDDENKAVISSREKTRQSNDNPPPVDGRPALAAQSRTNRSAAWDNGGDSPFTDRSSEVDRQFEPSRSIRRTRTAGLTPKNVSVTVAVPTSYFDQVYEEIKRKNESLDPPKAVPSAEDIEKREKNKIKDAVANVVRAFQTDKTSTDSQVHVASFVHIPPPKPQRPALGDRALGWLSRYWSTLGLFGLSAFGLVMLRSMVKSIPPRADQGFWPVSKPMRPPAADEGDGERAGDGSSPNLRDELSGIVREDPQAAARVIRGWLGKSG